MVDKRQERAPATIAEIDRTIHEPARFLILACRSVVESTDFLFLMNQTGLTKGNLSSHLSKLEASGYISIKKAFVLKIPRTHIRLSTKGRKAFDVYRRNMREVLDNLPLEGSG